MRPWHFLPFGGVANFGQNDRPEFRPEENEGVRSHCFKHFPTHAPSGFTSLAHLKVVGTSSLAEKEELAARLGLGSPSTTSDRDILLHAYAKWGERTPEYLEGRFSFVVWDQRKRQLFACRDHFGSLPLVYSYSLSRFIFAGDMETMLETCDLPLELNASTLAACKLLFTYSLAPGATFFKGICSLPPASYLVVDRAGIRVGQYWTPSVRPELVPTKEDEVFEKTHELVERAVAACLPHTSCTALAFSGGLDSSLIAVLAATALRRQNKSLLALAAVNDPRNSQIPDERQFMSVLRSVENLQIRYVTASGRGPFDGIEDPALFRTSCVRFSRFFLDDALDDEAAAAGAGAVLCGAFGEMTVSGTPQPFFMDAAVRLRWGTLFSELKAVSAKSGHTPLRVLAGEVRGHFFPRVWDDSYFLSSSFLRAHPPAPLQLRGGWPNSRRTTLRNVNRKLNYDALLSTGPRHLVLARSKPFENRRLFEFCMSVPAEFHMKAGINRYLLRKSFERNLPEAISSRLGKLPYSPDYALRYNAQLAKATEFAQSIRQSDPVREVVDVERLQKSIRALDPRMAPPINALAGIPRSVYLVNFLRQFPAFRI
jgi:asparagine synthase (glutamine-hydrolysing)